MTNWTAFWIAITVCIVCETAAAIIIVKALT